MLVSRPLPMTVLPSLWLCNDTNTYQSRPTHAHSCTHPHPTGSHYPEAGGGRGAPPPASRHLVPGGEAARHNQTQRPRGCNSMGQ